MRNHVNRECNAEMALKEELELFITNRLNTLFEQKYKVLRNNLSDFLDKKFSDIKNQFATIEKSIKNMELDMKTAVAQQKYLTKAIATTMQDASTNIENTMENFEDFKKSQGFHNEILDSSLSRMQKELRDVQREIQKHNASVQSELLKLKKSFVVKTKKTPLAPLQNTYDSLQMTIAEAKENHQPIKDNAKAQNADLKMLTQDLLKLQKDFRKEMDTAEATIKKLELAVVSVKEDLLNIKSEELQRPIHPSDFSTLIFDEFESDHFKQMLPELPASVGRLYDSFPTGVCFYLSFDNAYSRIPLKGLLYPRIKRSYIKVTSEHQEAKEILQPFEIMTAYGPVTVSNYCPLNYHNKGDLFLSHNLYEVPEIFKDYDFVLGLDFFTEFNKQITISRDEMTIGERHYKLYGHFPTK